MSTWRPYAVRGVSRPRFESIDRFTIQQGGLGFRTARNFGLTGTAFAGLAITVPGTVSLSLYPLCLLALALLAGAHMLLTRVPHLISTVTIYAFGMIAILVVGIAAEQGADDSTRAALAMLAGWGVGGIGAILTEAWWHWILLAYALFTSTWAATVLGGTELSGVALSVPVLSCLLWGVSTAYGLWLNRTATIVINRLTSIGETYLVERSASEAEAQRHRDARLLHDTALATLTLLAHGGRGVDATALRAQAESDRDLLRRLREGESPTPRSSGAYTLTHTAELKLSGTLEAVKARFARSALDVHWHGSGQIGLPQDRLDAFILALTECIENVRRHANVDDAHVTLSDDGTIVRGVVTDAGRGFDMEKIQSSSLGFQQSVVARIEEIDGSVRVFSAPGAGTTVVLEVPK